jgi:hypothetical protein
LKERFLRVISRVNMTELREQFAKELLAELEHERWMKEKLDNGYSRGPERDEERRTHPDLVPWSDLPEESRQYDRDTVTAIPEFMAKAKFEVYRL